MNDTGKVFCKHLPGKLMPKINFSACESKMDCIKVCPYNVFEMQEITPVQYKALSFTGKIKTMFHGRKKAFAVRPEACHACGLCITACPEKAITLVNALTE
jgi:NAD-dependent dihydropyrimidine dehydrogenase PreA subunit